jgi:YHS domain-containing protein
VEEYQYQNEDIVYDRVCVVCGKGVKIEESSVHLKVEGEMISICCPLCYEAYQKRPSSFLALRALRVAQKRSIEPENIEIDR